METQVKYELQEGNIQFNFEELKNEVIAETSNLLKVVVTEDTMGEFKTVRADLNKKIAFISNERIKIKKQWNLPYLAFEEKVTEIVKVYEQAVSAIDVQIKRFEFERYEAAKEAARQAFLGYGVTDVTFERIYVPAWGNKSNEKTWQGELDAVMNRIVSDLAFIDTIENEMLKKITRDEYLKVLDIVKAQTQGKILYDRYNPAPKIELTSKDAFLGTPGAVPQQEQKPIEPYVQVVKKDTLSIKFKDFDTYMTAMQILDEHGIKYENA